MWYLSLLIFLDRGFKYEPYICNVCHNLTRKTMNFNDAATVSVKGSDYKTHFWYIRENDAINIMKNYNLNEKGGLL